MPAALTEPLPADVIAAAQRGNTIEAIRLLRERTGMGLTEATAAVDAWCNGDAPVIQDLDRRGPGASGSMTALWIVVVVLCVGLGAYFFLPMFR